MLSLVVKMYFIEVNEHMNCNKGYLKPYNLLNLHKLIN